MVVILLSIGAGCTSSPVSERHAVEEYVTRLQAWSPVEGEIGAAIDRIVATHFVDEAEVRRQIAESRSRLRAHMVDIRTYRPRTDAIRRLHAEYTMAWGRLMRTYLQIETGLEQGDQRALADGRQGLLRWRRDLRGIADHLRRLLEQYDAAPSRTKDGPPTAVDGPPS
jgi:hypothetical protein